MKKERFDPAPVMARLKDFQRKTVDYVFQRMYLDTPPAPRFLVADEVGLGKTLVARGLIAQALAHLDDEIERIDVIYVCSNAAIAAQNLHRLNVAGREGFNLPTRLTLLPKHVSQLQDRHINFISFTPGTTFDLKSSGGVMEERSLIYRMLQDEPWLDARGFLHLLRCTAGERWESFVKWDNSNYDDNIAKKYRTHVRNDRKLRKRIEELCDIFHRKNANTNGFSADRYALVGDLRRRLGMICLDALEPDLVILDEFQRFRDLLDGKDEAADLARQLFEYPNVRVLLLSATPYKMLALDHEGNDDHYPDFLRTLGFLFKYPSEEATVREEIRRFRQALFSLAAGDYSCAKTAREALQSRLSRVMCRTERVSMTVKLDAMLGEPKVDTPVASTDLSHAMLIGRACRELGAGDSVEYWKSSPYLLNFLRGYDFRRRLENGKPPLPDELLRVIQDARALCANNSETLSLR